MTVMMRYATPSGLPASDVTMQTSLLGSRGWRNDSFLGPEQATSRLEQLPVVFNADNACHTFLSSAHASALALCAFSSHCSKSRMRVLVVRAVHVTALTDPAPPTPEASQRTNLPQDMYSHPGRRQRIANNVD